LLLFPFLAFPELWENIYVAVLGFIIAYVSMVVRYKASLLENEEDEETSLQEYVKDLKKRFDTSGATAKSEKNSKRISDISIDAK
ncbi:MAG: hypothetical protein ACPGTS_01515, partial [Minisyncoccia bacterium]